jgi:hypothetical protein
LSAEQLSLLARNLAATHICASEVKRIAAVATPHHTDQQLGGLFFLSSAYLWLY